MSTSNQLDDQFGTTDTVSKINDSRDQIRQESPQTIDWAKALQEHQMRDIIANNEYREIMHRENYDRLQNEANRQDSIEKAIAATDPRTGRLSAGQLKLLNENRGIFMDGNDVQDGQIVEGGYIGKTGDYGFVIAHPGSDGKVNYERRRFSRGDLYGMMSNRPDLFLPQDVDAVGKALQAADTSFVPKGRLAGLTAKYKAQIDKRNADMESVRNAMNLGNNRLEVEKAKQAGMNYRADNRVSMQEKIFKLRKEKLEERTAKRLQAANSAKEKNKILAEAKKAELQLRNEELEAKYAQMWLQYGIGEVRDKAKKKVADKLETKPKEDGGDKATIKSGDNTHDDKTITGYRYNKDRTKRIPVYSDGSQGSVEDVQ